MTDPAGPEKQATDQEARFFFAVLKHMKSKPDTDWEAVAQELNYSNANTAQVGRLASLYRHRLTPPFTGSFRPDQEEVGLDL